MIGLMPYLRWLLRGRPIRRLMHPPAIEEYLEYRQRFGVTRELALDTLAWAEPLARSALGWHAKRDMMGLGEELQVIPVLTEPESNGGWGELMPVWFKPSERPMPIFVLDNWALFALLWHRWLGEVGPAYNIENLLKIFIGGDLLIPFMPPTQRGGQFLRHGALTLLLGILWLPPDERDSFLTAVMRGGRRFAQINRLNEKSDLAAFMSNLEFEAFFMAEGRKVGGIDKIKALLDNQAQFDAYNALPGGICFGLSTLYDWYGPDWEEWIFQTVNVQYRYARFGLEAWARWLEVQPLNSSQM